MKVSDVTRVSDIGSKDFGRVLILPKANNEKNHRVQGNVIGVLKFVRMDDDGRTVLLLDTPKGDLEAFVDEDWTAIFPTQAHPLFPNRGRK